MKFVLYTNSVSTHQLPLAREIVRLVGAENFRYIYTGDNPQHGAQEVAATDPWILQTSNPPILQTSNEWLETADVLLFGGLRPIDLVERRSAKGLKTFYQSERWFKPIPLFAFTSRLHFLFPGWLRMLVPGYRRMAKRFVRLARTDPNFHVLPIGPWAKRDFLRLGVPEEKMTDWGYFVEPSAEEKNAGGESGPTADGAATVKPQTSNIKPHASLRVLWVGRPIWLKRVDTIRRAVAHVPGATLDVFSELTPAAVREEMRRHDVFVFASNALEGWGAVVSEALAEGLAVVGTSEAGASAALLPKENLFPAGDWRALARILAARSYVRSALPRAFTPAGAAAWLVGSKV